MNATLDHLQMSMPVDPKKKNAKLLAHFRFKLSSSDTFIEFANRLRVWATDQRAYYDDVKPTIIELLEHARTTLKRILGVSTMAPFNIHNHTDNDFSRSYKDLVETVYLFRDKFPRSDPQPSLRARLQLLFITVTPPPPLQDIIDVDAEPEPMTSLLPSSSFVTAVAAPLAAPLQSHPVSASTKEEPDSTSSMQPISAPSIPSSQLPSFSLPATATPNPSPVALTPVSAATILPHSKSRKKKKALLAELQNLDDPNAASLTEVQSTRSSAPLVPSMIDIHQGQSLPSETASSATPTATLANFDDQSAPSPQNTQPHPSTTPPLELSVDAQPVQSSSGDSTCPAVPEATPVVPTSGSFRQVEGHSSIGPERARSVSSAPNFLDGPLKSQSPVLERATKIQLRPSSSPVLDRAPGSHSPATNFLDQAFTSPPPSLSLAHLTAPSNSVAVEHQPAERRQMPSHDVQESVEMTSLKPTEKIKDAMEVDSDPLVGGETADKTTDDAMDVDVVQQIPSMDSMLPMPLSAESAPSAASAPLVRGQSASVSPPEEKTRPRRVSLPNSAGFDTTVTTRRLDGLKGSKEVDVNFMVNEEQYKSTESWNCRMTKPIHKDRRNTLCFSFACYVRSELEKNGEDYNLLRSQWPRHQQLYLTVTKRDGTNKTIMLGPPPVCTSDGFVDLGPYIKPGNNKIQICQNGDLSGYVFCLHIHTPTLAQVQKLNKMLQDETEWEEWKRSVSGPINIPPSRFLQEM